MKLKNERIKVIDGLTAEVCLEPDMIHFKTHGGNHTIYYNNRRAMMKSVLAIDTLVDSIERAQDEPTEQDFTTIKKEPFIKRLKQAFKILTE